MNEYSSRTTRDLSKSRCRRKSIHLVWAGNDVDVVVSLACKSGDEGRVIRAKIDEKMSNSSILERNKDRSSACDRFLTSHLVCVMGVGKPRKLAPGWLLN